MLILLVIAIFSVVVLIHETGHFIMARRNGIAVEEFGFGFPPRLIGRKFGRTLYSVNLLPLGGFVRLKGEESGDAPDSFGAARFGVKAKVLLAGVVMNLLLAYVILLGLCLTGLPPVSDSQPNIGHPVYSQSKRLVVSQVLKGSPAAESGIQAGDFIISANNQRLFEEKQLFDFTKNHAGERIKLQVERGSHSSVTEVQLRDPSSKVGFLGVATFQTYNLRYGLAEAVWVAGYLTLQILAATIVGVIMLLIKLPLLVIGLFGRSVPAAAEAASGPLGIFFILKNISVFGVSYIILFVANISVALAGFNVLPIPALDGGRLAVETYQKLSKRTLPQTIATRIYTLGFVFLMTILVIFTVYDIRKFFR